MLIFIAIFTVLVALGFCLASGWSDWGGLTIPNIYPAGIIVSFLVGYGAFFIFAPESVYFQDLKSHFLAAFLVFGISFVLFSLKVIGAGDSKLMSAVALWTGMQGLFSFLFFMGIGGAVLGVIALYVQKKKPIKTPKEGSWFDRIQKGESAVPYGIAIAFGAVVSFVQIGYFTPQSLMALASGGTS